MEYCGNFAPFQVDARFLFVSLGFFVFKIVESFDGIELFNRVLPALFRERIQSTAA